MLPSFAAFLPFRTVFCSQWIPFSYLIHVCANFSCASSPRRRCTPELLDAHGDAGVIWFPLLCRLCGLKEGSTECYQEKVMYCYKVCTMCLVHCPRRYWGAVDSLYDASPCLALHIANWISPDHNAIESVHLQPSLHRDQRSTLGARSASTKALSKAKCGSL